MLAIVTASDRLNLMASSRNLSTSPTLNRLSLSVIFLLSLRSLRVGLVLMAVCARPMFKSVPDGLKRPYQHEGPRRCVVGYPCEA